MAVAIYVRVSTEEQRERQSIRTQIEFAERYCALRDLAVYRIYSDDGISGTVPLDQRPEGSQILRDARNGEFVNSIWPTLIISFGPPKTPLALSFAFRFW